MKFECKDKEQYETKEEANRKIFKDMVDSYGGCVNLRPYRCKFCKKYHLAKRT